MDIQEIKEMFVEEANEFLDVLENNLNLMKNEFNNINDEIILETYRAAHSIKGTSGFLALEHITSLSKAMEHKLSLWRDKEKEPNPEDIHLLHNAFLKLKELVDNLDNQDIENLETIIQTLSE